MAQASRTFRLFVSSTFSDLKEERNALQREVFPRLRELCLQHGCRFQAIDLRWGVTSEAALDQQTMKICLDEIRRCQRATPRPNFLVLLGDRYGWRPLPAEIPSAEFEQIKQRIADTDELTLLDQWYRRDDNAVPAVYCLQPREGEFVEFDNWDMVERRLRRLLVESTEGMTLEEERLKYAASATEQEIVRGAMQVVDAREHVFGFFRRISNIDSLASDPAAKDFIDTDESGRPDSEARARLDELKGRLRASLRGNVFEYESRWTGNSITADHIRKLCDDVFRCLSRVIEKEIKRIEEIDPLEKEIADHESFGKDRARFFTGRAGILQTISDYIAGDDPHPLAVTGESGSGKSALLARAVEQIQRDHPDAVIIHRFIGATPASSDGRALLESLCREISQRFSAKESGIPTDYRKLAEEFPKRLSRAKAERPLIVFLDALDQLSHADHARNLAWLPARLPAHARVVVSTLEGEPLSALRRKLPTASIAELESMTIEEGSDLLDLWLKDAARALVDHQRSESLRKFESSGLPLYLRLAFEEARSWKSYTPAKELKADIPGMLRELFCRLSTDHTQTMVSRSLSYLVAAKNGLSEDELIDALSLDDEVMDDFLLHAHHELPERRLPVVVWSRLFFDLESYLTERSADGTALLAFYHRQMAEVIEEDYLAGGEKKKRHQSLARYFHDQPLRIEKDGKKNPNVRKVSELPFQQTRGQLRGELEKILCDLEFIQSKCAAGLTYELVQNYIDGERLWAESRERANIYRSSSVPERFRLFWDFVSLHAHIFAHDPTEVLPFAYNYAEDGPVVESAKEKITDDQWRKSPWVELVERPALVRNPALLRTLEGHEGEVTGVAVSQDGRIALSSSDDGTIRVWELATGNCLHILFAHRDGINGVSLTPDGKTAVSAGVEGTVSTWDIESGNLVTSLVGHEGEVLSVAISTDGKTAVSGGADGTVKLWDIAEGKLIATMDGHFGEVNCVAISADASLIVSGGADCHIRLWDAETEKTIRCLKGHDVPVQGVDLDETFSVIASSSGQPADAGGIVVPALLYASEVRFWDTDGACVFAGTGHEIGDRGGRIMGVLNTMIHDIAISSDASKAISGGYDRAVCVWMGERGYLLNRLHGHLGPVLSVALDGEGAIGVTGSADRTVRVWKIDGDAPPLMKARRRIGRTGRSARAGIEERAALLWRNARVKKWFLIPLLSLLFAYAFDRPLAYFMTLAVPSFNVKWTLAAAFLTVWWFCYSIEWRSSLKSDPHVWKFSVIPRAIRFLLSLLFIPLFLFFPVLDCPLCGSRMSGRRRLLHCARCGFRDRFCQGGK